MVIKHKMHKSHKSHKSHKLHSKKTKKHTSRKVFRKHKSTIKSRYLNKKHIGGANCSLASVKEPGFTVPMLGDIPGLSISSSRGAIYRPNCTTDTYQAATP